MEASHTIVLNECDTDDDASISLVPGGERSLKGPAHVRVVAQLREVKGWRGGWDACCWALFFYGLLVSACAPSPPTRQVSGHRVATSRLFCQDASARYELLVNVRTRGDAFQYPDELREKLARS